MLARAPRPVKTKRWSYREILGVFSKELPSTTSNCILQFLTVKEQIIMTRVNNEWMYPSQAKRSPAQAVIIDDADISFKPRLDFDGNVSSEVCMNFSNTFENVNELGVVLRKLPSKVHQLSITLANNMFDINCFIARFCGMVVNEFNLNFQQGFSCRTPKILTYNVKAQCVMLTWDVLDVDQTTLEHILLAYDIPPIKLEMKFNNVYDIDMCMSILSIGTRRFRERLRFPLFTILSFRITTVMVEEVDFLTFHYCSCIICNALESDYENDPSILRYVVHDEISGRRREFTHEIR